jgi:hypothetical protein
MNNVCSIFRQLLQLFPRVEFQHVVKETHGERYARGFPCWSQFVSMLFCQLARPIPSVRLPGVFEAVRVR